MKRHYTRTVTGYRCASCRQEFSTRREFGQHCGNRENKCRHPLSMGLSIDLAIGPYHWTKAA